MALVEIHGYERQNVYTADRADLLYVRHKINMTCQVLSGGNPYGLAVQTLRDNDARLRNSDRTAGFLGEPSGTLRQETLIPLNRQPLPSSGEFMAATDRLLVPLLLTPRRKLKLTAYRQTAGGGVQPFVYLESPRPGLNADCLNGPHPLGCTLTEATGEAPVSGVLNFQIETHVPLADNDASRPIISHRWTMTLGHDEDFYATREISGEAVFDVGLLGRYAESPDAFISQLYHPIPLGFRRNLPQVSLSSDGSRLTYSITDTAVPCVFDAADSGATQMFIAENWKFTSPHGVSFWGNSREGGSGWWKSNVYGPDTWWGRNLGLYINP